MDAKKSDDATNTLLVDGKIPTHKNKWGDAFTSDLIAWIEKGGENVWQSLHNIHQEWTTTEVPLACQGSNLKGCLICELTQKVSGPEGGEDLSLSPEMECELNFILKGGGFKAIAGYFKLNVSRLAMLSHLADQLAGPQPEEDSANKVGYQQALRVRNLLALFFLRGLKPISLPKKQCTMSEELALDSGKDLLEEFLKFFDVIAAYVAQEGPASLLRYKQEMLNFFPVGEINKEPLLASGNEDEERLRNLKHCWAMQILEELQEKRNRVGGSPEGSLSG